MGEPCEFGRAGPGGTAGIRRPDRADQVSFPVEDLFYQYANGDQFGNYCHHSHPGPRMVDVDCLDVGCLDVVIVLRRQGSCRYVVYCQ